MLNSPLAYNEAVVESTNLGPLRLAILGTTGSIGRQTLDLVKAHPERFQVTALSANRRIEPAVEACLTFRPRYLVMCDDDAAQKAKQMLAAAGCETHVLSGAEHLPFIATLEEVDLVVTATVGYSGFIPTVAAVKADKDIALANKETLVVGGEIIRELMRTSTSRIFPIDSEHSAIAQCLRGEDAATVDRLIVTASGGPFRTWSKSQLEKATAADALKHPNWDMGAKITIDSATMMNKAFEIIEAHYLFGMPASRIRAVVHPQSVVHSMVQFTDGSLKAQLGVPDMHLPIAYALGLNNRIAGAERPIELTEMSRLTFEEPDVDKFPCLSLAEVVLTRKGNSACVVNAANEVAVDAFLKGKLRFTSIFRIIDKTLSTVRHIANPDVEDLIATDRESRKCAETLILNA